MEEFHAAVSICEDSIMMSEQNFHRRINEQDSEGLYGIAKLGNLNNAISCIQQKVSCRIEESVKYQTHLEKIQSIIKDEFEEKLNKAHISNQKNRIVIRDLAGKEAQTLDLLTKKLDEYKISVKRIKNVSQEEIEQLERQIKMNDIKLNMFQMFY